MNWSEEQIAKLKTGIEQGLTASAIARMVGGGKTRNAVIGKAHRLDLTFAQGLSPAQREAVRQGARRSKLKMFQKARQKRVATGHAHQVGPLTGLFKAAARDRAAQERAIVRADATPPQALMVSLLDLEPHHCRWPIGEVGKPGFGFCGCERAPVGSYCTHHAQMAVREVYVSPEAGYWGSNMRKRFAAA